MDAGLHCPAAACGAGRQLPDLQGICAADQRSVKTTDDAAWTLRVPLRPRTGHLAGRGGAGLRDRQALLHGRDVAGFHLHRGACHAGRGHEPHRWQVQYRRGRRRPGALPAGFEGHSHPDRCHAGQRAGQGCGGGRLSLAGRRLAALAHQAGGIRALRRHRRIPGLGRPDPDQDGAGRQAGRGRAAARSQGQRLHRAAALLGAGRGAHLAAAAPRHLFHRGHCPAHS